MNRFFFYVLVALCALFSFSTYGETEQFVSYTFEVVHAPDLKAWLDAGKTIVILDARSKDDDDGKRLPGAKLVPYDGLQKEIDTAIPSKETLVVVYCSNSHCPASKLLADRLLELGYKKVYKYPEGIADWTARGYPVQEAK